MKRALILAFLCVSPCFSQTFKGNALGMPLEEFKQANKGQQVWINTGDPTKRTNKKLSRLVDTPLCTDTIDGFPGTQSVPHRSPGEVVCNVSPAAFNLPAKMIGRMDMREILYHFYGGKLYEVSLSFRAIQFEGMRSEFSTKFGPPSEVSKIECQNGFGARWTGDFVSWKIAPTVTASLYEGCSNGPGQNAEDGFSNGSLQDSSLQPMQTTAQRAADF
jgi:hypothetical protein